MFQPPDPVYSPGFGSARPGFGGVEHGRASAWTAAAAPPPQSGGPAPALDVIEVDSLALLEDRFRQVLLMVSGAGHEHGFDLGALDPAELTGLPGVQELLALLEITQFAKDGRWDAIVVDCPPSADMLRIVTAPDTLLGYVERVWPAHARTFEAIGTDFRKAVLAVTVEQIVQAVSEARDLLADRTRTGARLVTAPEQVAVAESARVRSAAALLGLRLDAVLVNKVLPELPPPGPAGPSHPAVQWYFNRRGEQLDVVGRLRERLRGVAVRVVGHAGAEPVGLSSLAALSYAVDASGDWVGGPPIPMLGTDADGVLPVPAEPMVRLESGAGVHSVFAMRMHLPVVDPSTLRLGRVEDDLIVGADGVRRRLRLAPVLRRCTVETAELDGDQLVIRFRPDPQVWPK
ncbi:ArsA family ATPase [Nocardia yunnanensis]|uniref:ArsA family ATPase n=1 Tax=Nocardia yunnanensis TaxID=2382165 RepID=A0A386ZEF7_9NOCA|nr:ArsA-related P-loop ATPase [Nocardia yunnanensis]AYF75573.1 ArsA family ATPase [Nocardia yunnanensis]